MDDVKKITVDEFEDHGAARSPIALHFVEELEFYSALDGWYLGVLLRDRSDDDFSFAVLGPDETGSKRWIAGGDSIKHESDARTSMLTKLRSVAAGGRQTHRQD